MEVKIKIAEEFSKTPGARYYKDGKKSGQEFYETLLSKKFKTALEKKEKLTVDLDGTEGYATSFLDEAFRSLAEEFTPKVVLENLEIISEDEPDWKEEITNYIQEAKPKTK